jgi:hypothetical protein
MRAEVTNTSPEKTHVTDSDITQLTESLTRRASGSASLSQKESSEARKSPHNAKSEIQDPHSPTTSHQSVKESQLHLPQLPASAYPSPNNDHYRRHPSLTTRNFQNDSSSFNSRANSRYLHAAEAAESISIDSQSYSDSRNRRQLSSLRFSSSVSPWPNTTSTKGRAAFDGPYTKLPALTQNSHIEREISPYASGYNDTDLQVTKLDPVGTTILITHND